MNNLPTITKNLLIINVLMYLATVVLQMRLGIDLSDYLGLHFFMASDFRVWQLFTYMFMHGSFMHVFFNMFAVWMFGRIMERVWGSERFLFFYLVCGIGAGLVQELVQYVQYVVELSHYTQVNIGYAVVSMDVPMPIKAKYFVAFYAVIELLEGLSLYDNVAHFAHLGGMIFGYILIRYWRNKHKNNGYYYQ